MKTMEWSDALRERLDEDGFVRIKGFFSDGQAQQQRPE